MTIRNIDDQLKSRLRVQAAQHGHSMGEEAILATSSSKDFSDSGTELINPWQSAIK